MRALFNFSHIALLFHIIFVLHFLFRDLPDLRLPPFLFAFVFLSPTPRAFSLLSERISTLAVHPTIQQFIRIAWLKQICLAFLILRPAFAAVPTLNARVPKLSESPTTPYCTDSVRYNVLAPTLNARVPKLSESPTTFYCTDSLCYNVRAPTLNARVTSPHQTGMIDFARRASDEAGTRSVAMVAGSLTRTSVRH